MSARNHAQSPVFDKSLALGDEVRRLRQLYGWPITVLAVRSDIPAWIIQRIETIASAKLPPAVVIVRLAGALGVSVEHLVTVAASGQGAAR